MSSSIQDKDYEILVALSSLLEQDYAENGESDPWKGSPFSWIKTRPSRQVGKIGEQLISGWCAAKGLSVMGTGDTEADRIIGGMRFEIKFSTLWKSGVYKFQQIRDQDYSFLFCLGLSPFSANAWVISKELLYKHVIGHTPQHTGRGGTDTFWLSFPADEPPDWLSECGGTLRGAYKVLENITR